MPSWFHVIGIALTFNPPPHLLFLLQLVCIWFKFAAFPFVSTHSAYCMGSTLNAFWTMSVLSRLTAASYWLCLQVCVTNKTLVSINQLLSSFSFFSFHSAHLTSLSARFAWVGKSWAVFSPEVFTNDLLPPRGQTGNCNGALCIPILHQGRAKCCAGKDVCWRSVLCHLWHFNIFEFLYLWLTTPFVGEIICQQKIKVCRSEHLGLWWEVGGMWIQKELSQCLWSDYF